MDNLNVGDRVRHKTSSTRGTVVDTAIGKPYYGYVTVRWDDFATSKIVVEDLVRIDRKKIYTQNGWLYEGDIVDAKGVRGVITDIKAPQARVRYDPNQPDPVRSGIYHWYQLSDVRKETATARRSFKVGDRVRSTLSQYRKAGVGVVTKVEGDLIHVRWGESIYKTFDHYLELVDDAREITFNVGDRVRDKQNGSTGVVVSVSPNGMKYASVAWDEGHKSVRPLSFLELIDDTRKLKVGDRVKNYITNRHGTIVDIDDHNITVTYDDGFHTTYPVNSDAALIGIDDTPIVKTNPATMQQPTSKEEPVLFNKQQTIERLKAAHAAVKERVDSFPDPKQQALDSLDELKTLVENGQEDSAVLADAWEAVRAATAPRKATPDTQRLEALDAEIKVLELVEGDSFEYDARRLSYLINGD